LPNLDGRYVVIVQTAPGKFYYLAKESRQEALTVAKKAKSIVGSGGSVSVEDAETGKTIWEG